MTKSPAELRRLSPAGKPPIHPIDITQPLAGVRSPVIATATRRVERRWRSEQKETDSSKTEVVTGLLAALALAVDHRRPGYVTELLPRPSAGLIQRLVEMLRTELVRCWSEASTPTPPSVILETLSALEHVRQEVELDNPQPLEAPLAGPEEMDLLVEIAHDLRSPLTSILFLAETLQRGQSGDVNDVQRRQLGLIYSAALGLSSLVSDAIELARGGEELADQELSPFSVTELLESVRGIVRPMAEEKGLTIRLLPPEIDHRLGHPVALSRVLLNLTTNALKFTDEGFVEITCLEKTHPRIEFSVRDSGPGINPEAMTSLFQPFRPARGRSGYCFSGTGLGLAITRRLVAAMGADLRFETRARWGTRFYFELGLPAATPV